MCNALDVEGHRAFLFCRHATGLVSSLSNSLMECLLFSLVDSQGSSAFAMAKSTCELHALEK